MKTGDLVKYFGVSDTTIRRWVSEFEDFLSDNAKQAHSKHRSFTSDDFLVLATIHALSKDNLPLNHIKAKLSQGYRIEDVTAATVGYEDGRMVPATAVEQIIDAAELRVELETAKARLDYLQQELEKRDQRLQEKDKAIETLRNEIAELRERVGRAEGELIYRRQLDKRD